MCRLIARVLLLDLVCQALSAGYDIYGTSEQCQVKEVDCYFSGSYPNFDGSCNNLDNPTWGASNTILPRLLPAEYSDNKGSPRVNGVFGKLTSTRKISNIMKESEKVSSSGISHLHVLYGQMLAHDIVHTGVVKNDDGTELDCNCASPHKDCFNIKIPRDDEQFLKTLKTCMGLKRSKPATGLHGCKILKRQQSNSMSSYIDGTFLYGKTEREAGELRDFNSYGELKMVENPAHGTLKNLPNQMELAHANIAKTMDCPAKVHRPIDIPCFVSGDVRANENPGLQALQTIMSRYHNQIARELKTINPFWDGEKVFKTTRQIISALIQSITYREYLPPLLGPMWMKRFGLELSTAGYWNGYNPRYNPSITNGFTTAAFRYGHSQVAEILTRPTTYFRQDSSKNVKSEGTFFNNMALLERNGGGSGAFMRGFMIDKAEKTDATLTDALRNQLLTERGRSFGSDLFAINAQRGRDHGLPGYNKYRELCGLSRATSFADLSNEITPSTISKLQEAYRSVDDIDLYVGGLSENPVDGGEVGPTFACILAYGFRALRKGDRYWHEYELSPTRLTRQQLDAIRQTTFARILCDAGEDMKYVFKLPMMMQQARRRIIVSCANTPKLDLFHWKENSGFFNSYNSAGGTDWSSWFVTSYRNRLELNVAEIKSRLSKERIGKICENHISFETRHVRSDIYLQIRFGCPVGSIEESDFPFQLDEKHYWTPWMITKRFEFGSQTMEKADFGCEKIVDIQAKSRTTGSFALETGEAFENFGHETGFTCRDKHQADGSCEDYEVRALCLRRAKKYEPTTQESHTYAYGRSVIPSETPIYVPPAVPDPFRSVMNLFCSHYNICCRTTIGRGTNYIPTNVLEFANSLCLSYKLCCNI